MMPSTPSAITTRSLSALFCVLLLCSASVAAERPLPNIVILLADDLGYGDAACYNRERGKIPTPNIDRLASEGMRFTDAHSSSGVCSPSRYTLLTGRYHWRTRLQRGIVGVWEKPLIAPDRLTIAGLLKRQGYRTACIGKWHLGWDWPIGVGHRAHFARRAENAVANESDRKAWRATFSKPIGQGPTTRGFDMYFGTDVPNWPPYCFIENNRTVGIPSQFLPPRMLHNHLASRQGPAVEDWQLTSILPTLGDKACEFILRESKKPQPYLLYMPLTSPHTPLAVNQPWRGKSGLGVYADLVMETDAVVGRVLAAIDQSGAKDNTLVIFTSDNGCAPYIGVGALEAKGHFPSGPLRGYKSDVWEGGHRVPMIVRWPRVVAKNSVCRQLVQQADFMATFADIAGERLAEQEGEDSVSLWPLFQRPRQPVRETAVSQSMRGTFSVRKAAWKLILAPGSGGWSKGRSDQPAQLYYLENDLGETNNLLAEKPNKAAELHAALQKLVADGRSTPGAVQKNDVKVSVPRLPSAASPPQP